MDLILEKVVTTDEVLIYNETSVIYALELLSPVLALFGAKEVIRDKPLFSSSIITRHPER